MEAAAALMVVVASRAARAASREGVGHTADWAVARVTVPWAAVYWAAGPQVERMAPLRVPLVILEVARGATSEAGGGGQEGHAARAAELAVAAVLVVRAVRMVETEAMAATAATAVTAPL